MASRVRIEPRLRAGLNAFGRSSKPAADGAGLLPIPGGGLDAGRRRRTVADRLGALFIGAMTLIALIFLAGGLYDHVRRQMERPFIAARWDDARRVLAARLHQQDPLEFGAVWATHSGMICGLVNGRGSFSGLAGMTPFAVEHGQAIFALDQTALSFAPYWRDCMTDQWIKVLDGSMQAGGCATRLGQARCVTVVGG